MDWNTVVRRYGYILRSEVRRRWFTWHDQNLDIDDLWQVACLTAWKYCRCRGIDHIDPAVLRNTVRCALYDAVVKSHGVNVPRNRYREWASGESGYPVSHLESLDALLEDAESNTPIDTMYDPTESSVNVFVSMLTEPERRVLDECLRTGKRWCGTIARNTGMTLNETNSALRSLRRQAKRFFEYAS